MLARALGKHSQALGKLSRGLGKHSQPLSKLSQDLGKHSRPLSKLSQGLGKHSRPLSKLSQGLGKHSQPLGKLSQGLGKHSRALGKDQPFLFPPPRVPSRQKRQADEFQASETADKPRPIPHWHSMIKPGGFEPHHSGKARRKDFKNSTVKAGRGIPGVELNRSLAAGGCEGKTQSRFKGFKGSKGKARRRAAAGGSFALRGLFFYIVRVGTALPAQVFENDPIGRAPYRFWRRDVRPVTKWL